MKIHLNDEVKEIAENSTITMMMERLNLEIINGIALAINDEVIPKTTWDQHQLKQDDKLLLIRTIAGG